MARCAGGGALDRFREVLKGIVLEAIGSEVGIPARRWGRIVRAGNSVSFPVVIKPDFVAFTNGLRSSLRCLPELVRVVQTDIALSDRFLKDTRADAVESHLIERLWHACIAPLLDEYFTEVGEKRYEDIVFERLYSSILAEIEGRPVTVEKVTLVTNLNWDAEEARLEPNIRIGEASDDLLEEWSNLGLSPLGFGWSPTQVRTLLFDTPCVIKVTFEKAPTDPTIIDISTERNVLTAIRLLTGRSITGVFTAVKTRSVLESRSLGGTPWVDVANTRPFVPKATVSASQLGELSNLWGHLQNSPNLSRLNLALRRWNAATERTSPEDSLLDYWIALESLFMTGINSELKFRASLRIAAMLGRTPEERVTIFEDMSNSYNARSEIVHGTICKRDTSQIIELTRSHLQTALLTILSSDEPFDPTTVEKQLLMRAQLSQ